MDGVFFDDLPGACCNSEHALPSHYSAAQTKVLCDATLDNFNAVAKILSGGGEQDRLQTALLAELRLHTDGAVFPGKLPIFSLFQKPWRPCVYDHRTILQRLQRGGASFARFSNTIVDRGSPKGFGGSCAQMVQDALAEAADGLSYMQWEDLRTDGVHNSKVSPDMLLNMSEALFLLVRAPGTWSFFGASTGWGKPSWSWEPTYDRLKAIGGPVGNATRLGGGHWSREYEHATVKLFCPPAGSNDYANGSVTLKSDDPQAGGLSLDIQSSDGFSISVSGTEWLEGLPPSLHTGGAWHQHGLTAPKPSSGSDGIGQFTAKAFAVKDSAGNEAELIFRQYAGGQTIVFALRFPAGANGTRTTDSATACKNCVSVAVLAFSVFTNSLRGSCSTGVADRCQ